MSVSPKYYPHILIGAAVVVAGIVVMKKQNEVRADSGDGGAEIGGNVLQAVPNPAATCGTAHFSMAEFNCHDGNVVPFNYRGNTQRLMEQLEVVRAAATAEKGKDTPIHINSGYRSPAYNKKVGGAVNSMHLYAGASDITIPGYTPAQVRTLLQRLIDQGKIIDGGIGSYTTFTHYDIGPKRRWPGP